jgi:hypothetical protein
MFVLRVMSHGPAAAAANSTIREPLFMPIRAESCLKGHDALGLVDNPSESSGEQYSTGETDLEVVVQEERSEGGMAGCTVCICGEGGN